MRSKILILTFMLMFLNMTSKVSLGNVSLSNITSCEIHENILEMSNTAKLTIPKNYAQLQGKTILESIKVGDKVIIQLGYDNQLETEFIGYIREIEAESPVVIHCEDESYIFRQTNYVKSYQNATLKEVLNDIIPADITVQCPDVNLGKFQIDNASAFIVLQELMKDYGLYSRLQNGVLKVGLAYDFGGNTLSHTYTIGKDVKGNSLKYKRKDDYKIRYKAISNNPDGTKTTVEVGSTERDASERTLNFAGPLSESELKEKAEAVMAKAVYDGFTGSIKGFGLPRTHAGDSLLIKNINNPEQEGEYLIEKVDITYNDSDYFTRENTLSYKI